MKGHAGYGQRSVTRSKVRDKVKGHAACHARAQRTPAHSGALGKTLSGARAPACWAALSRPRKIGLCWPLQGLKEARRKRARESEGEVGVSSIQGAGEAIVARYTAPSCSIGALL
jgi:hypothetical protein